jgi:hypothetical protein
MNMNQAKKIPLGLIVIAVVMFFVALATDIFWIARLAGRAFPQTLHLDSNIYNAFAFPDIVLSVFLYVGAFGLMKLRTFGLVASLVGMGMWIFDSLLVLGITGLTRIKIVGPCLFFAAFTILYLWTKRKIFS